MAAKGLFINSTEQGFTVRGVNNKFFPDDATLAYPANSVILITDESDMATFRSASNYDVLFSALIKDININGERVTKDNIIETFNEAANKPMSNPDAFTSVEYDGTKSLIFYNDKGDEVANVDVTPFIKDGMIEDVEISEGNLVIHFNTDSDIKDIYIPLTEIFDPEAYYTKQEIDNQVNDIWDTIDEKEEVISTSLNALNEDVENLSNDKNEFLVAMGQFDQRITANANAITTKANASDVYTKTEADNKFLTEHQSLDNYYTKDNVYTKAQVDTALASKANTADLATVATSGSYNDLSDKPTIPTVPTNVSAFTNDAGYLTQHQSLSDYYTKTETDNAIATAMEDIDLSDYVDVTTFNKKELATAKALTQLNDTKADKTELPDVSTLATKTELNAKANSADLATVATSGSYDDLTNKPVIPEGVTVDAALSDTSENTVQNKVVKGALDAKQDTISDLATIRSGAALGATAYQKPSTGIPASDIADGVIPTVPTNVSAFTNDAGYLTQHQSLADYYTKTQVDTALNGKQDTLTAGTGISIQNNVISATGGTQVQSDWNQSDSSAVDYIKNKPTIPAAQVNSDWNASSGVAEILNKPDLSIYAQSSTLATVATSGSYNDLTGKPTIPTVPTTVSSFTNDAGYLTNSDISSLEPYTIDLDALIANGVTSTQYDEIATASADGRVIKATYDGREYTVESVYVNVDVMKLTVSDELKHRFFQLTKTTGTVSPTTAEYVSLVEKGTWNTKQPLLVSGTNIKTINNQSILGEGNIEIQGGSSVTVDSALSSTSTNPVQNNVINTALNIKVSGNGISNIVKLTQSEYDALGVKDANTLYVINSQTGTGGF